MYSLNVSYNSVQPFCIDIQLNSFREIEPINANFKRHKALTDSWPSLKKLKLNYKMNAKSKPNVKKINSKYSIYETVLLIYWIFLNCRPWESQYGGKTVLKALNILTFTVSPPNSLKMGIESLGLLQRLLEGASAFYK